MVNNDRKKILGVGVDNLSRIEILDRIEEYLGDDKFHQITTVNPEFILEAQKNRDFRMILNRSDLNIADGIGIRFAFWRNFWHLKYRMTGADLMLEVLKIAEKRGIGVYLAVNKDGLSRFEEIRRSILRRYPRSNIYGQDIERGVKFSIGDSVPRSILLCNSGAPWQEMFINSVKCDNIRLAMGVGGSFDYLTGKVRRAPMTVRKLGLEWFWRILVQPENKWRRAKRVLRSIIIFPARVIVNR